MSIILFYKALDTFEWQTNQYIIIGNTDNLGLT